MKRTTLDLPDEVFEEVDRVRGDIPRNRWIVRAVEAALEPRRNPEMIDMTVSGGEIVKAVQVPTARRTEEGAPKVVDTLGREHYEALIADQQEAARQADGACPHPKAKRQVYGWGSLCGVCGARL